MIMSTWLIIAFLQSFVRQIHYEWESENDTYDKGHIWPIHINNLCQNIFESSGSTIDVNEDKNDGYD